MKIKRNRYRGTASISFGLGPEDDDAFKDWMREAKKPGASLMGAAEKIAAKRGVKVQDTTAPLDPDFED